MANKKANTVKRFVENLSKKVAEAAYEGGGQSLYPGAVQVNALPVIGEEGIENGKKFQLPNGDVFEFVNDLANGVYVSFAETLDMSYVEKMINKAKGKEDDSIFIIPDYSQIEHKRYTVIDRLYLLCNGKDAIDIHFVDWSNLKVNGNYIYRYNAEEDIAIAEISTPCKNIKIMPELVSAIEAAGLTLEDFSPILINTEAHWKCIQRKSVLIVDKLPLPAEAVPGVMYGVQKVLPRMAEITAPEGNPTPISPFKVFVFNNEAAFEASDMHNDEYGYSIAEDSFGYLEVNEQVPGQETTYHIAYWEHYDSGEDEEERTEFMKGVFTGRLKDHFIVVMCKKAISYETFDEPNNVGFDCSFVDLDGNTQTISYHVDPREYEDIPIIPEVLFYTIPSNESIETTLSVAYSNAGPDEASAWKVIGYEVDGVFSYEYPQE